MKGSSVYIKSHQMRFKSLPIKVDITLIYIINELIL